jgi:hypothetical protein
MFLAALQKQLNLPNTHRGPLDLPTNHAGRIFIKLIYIQPSELEL